MSVKMCVHFDKIIILSQYQLLCSTIIQMKCFKSINNIIARSCSNTIIYHLPTIPLGTQLNTFVSCNYNAHDP